MSLLPGTHLFLDPKCNEILDTFYECIRNKNQTLGNCDNLLIKLNRCKQEDLEAHRKMNKIQSEQKLRERIIKRDPIIQEKLEILKRLQEKQKDESAST